MGILLLEVPHHTLSSPNVLKAYSNMSLQASVPYPLFRTESIRASSALLVNQSIFCKESKDDVRIREFYYHRGTAIPRKLWDDNKNADITKILQIENVQVRSLLMDRIKSKYDNEADFNKMVGELGTVIHKGTQRMADKITKKMLLLQIDTPTDPIKFLRVECPSTGTHYYLNVPPTATKCNEALQWTYGVGDIHHKPIMFAQET